MSNITTLILGVGSSFLPRPSLIFKFQVFFFRLPFSFFASFRRNLRETKSIYIYIYFKKYVMDRYTFITIIFKEICIYLYHRVVVNIAAENSI